MVNLEHSKRHMWDTLSPISSYFQVCHPTIVFWSGVTSSLAKSYSQDMSVVQVKMLTKSKGIWTWSMQPKESNRVTSKEWNATSHKHKYNIYLYTTPIFVVKLWIFCTWSNQIQKLDQRLFCEEAIWKFRKYKEFEFQLLKKIQVESLKQKTTWKEYK